MDQVQSVPSDEELERIFASRREDFEMIRRMSDEDSMIVRITYEVMRVDDRAKSGEIEYPQFSDGRWNDYKTIFQRIGLESGISRGNEGSIWFDAYIFGLGVSGLTKGYVYSKHLQDCVSTSLDPPTIREGRGRECKKLDENWYLFISN